MTAHYVRLIKDLKVGKKIAPAGTVMTFNRRYMQKLVKKGDAYWCTQKGHRLTVSDEEE